jgi:hypothetical protein
LISGWAENLLATHLNQTVWAAGAREGSRMSHRLVGAWVGSNEDFKGLGRNSTQVR